MAEYPPRLQGQSPVPKKKLTKEIAIASIIRYWLFSAISAEMPVNIAIISKVANPAIFGSQVETTGNPELTSASTKPET